MWWRSRRNSQGGFTLLEALVALTVVLAFATVLAPVLRQARRIMAGADDRVAAQIVLRALLADPVDRGGLDSLAREGESQGLKWSVTAQPFGATFSRSAAKAADPPSPSLVAYRVVARVSWGQDQSVSAETVRLGTAVPRADAP